MGETRGWDQWAESRGVSLAAGDPEGESGKSHVYFLIHEKCHSGFPGSEDQLRC